MVGRRGGSSAQANVSSAGREGGVHSQAGRRGAAVGYPDDQGSGGADGCLVGLGADLRGRLAAGATRLPSWAKCAGRCAEGAGAFAIGAYGSGGRGLERILRQHSPRRPDEIGGPSRQRWSPAGPDEGLVGNTGGRAGRTCPDASNDTQQGRGAAHATGRSALAALI